MVKLTTTHTLHRYVDPFASLEVLEHLDHVRMRYHADNQEFIPEKLSFLWIQLDLVNLFDGAYVTSDFVH